MENYRMGYFLYYLPEKFQLCYNEQENETFH